MLPGNALQMAVDAQHAVESLRRIRNAKEFCLANVWSLETSWIEAWRCLVRRFRDASFDIDARIHCTSKSFPSSTSCLLETV